MQINNKSMQFILVTLDALFHFFMQKHDTLFMDPKMYIFKYVKKKRTNNSVQMWRMMIISERTMTSLINHKFKSVYTSLDWNWKAISYL